jgi:small conductance mechanosensitive channel
MQRRFRKNFSNNTITIIINGGMMEEQVVDNISVYTEKGMALAAEYGPKLLLALILLFVGLWIIRIFTRMFERAMDKASVEVSLRKFLSSLVNLALKALLLVSVISTMDIEMTSFVAIIGAAGLAVGLALQGSLANFAGGVLILLFKPFKVGDYIEASGQSGTVSEISVFNTILKTIDNKVVIVPNGALSNDIKINYTAESTRRVDLTFGIGYSDDLRKAKAILQEIANADERVHKEPAPFVAVKELGESSVDFTYRVWVNTADYWVVYFSTIEKVKLTFDERGVSIPFPQRDVHLYQKNN